MLCWSLKNSSLSLRHNSPRQSPALRPPLSSNLFSSCTILQSSFFPASELSIACMSWQSSLDWSPGNSTFVFCKVSLLVLRPLIFAGEGFLHAWFHYLASSTFFFDFIRFLMYLASSRHSVQTRFSRGSDSRFDGIFWLGICQILQDFARAFLTGPPMTRTFSGTYPS